MYKNDTIQVQILENISSIYFEVEYSVSTNVIYHIILCIYKLYHTYTKSKSHHTISHHISLLNLISVLRVLSFIMRMRTSLIT